LPTKKKNFTEDEAKAVRCIEAFVAQHSDYATYTVHALLPICFAHLSTPAWYSFAVIAPLKKNSSILRLGVSFLKFSRHLRY